jgi:hypothetical protein
MQNKFKIIEAFECFLAISDKKDEIDNSKHVLKILNDNYEMIAYMPKYGDLDLDLPLLPDDYGAEKLAIEIWEKEIGNSKNESLKQFFILSFIHGYETATAIHKEHDHIKFPAKFGKPKWFIAEIEGVKLKTMTNSKGNKVLIGTYLYDKTSN